MARLTAAQRRRLPLSDFAVPSKAPGPGSYPEPDKGHEMSAIGHSKKGSKARAAVVKKATEKGFMRGVPKPKALAKMKSPAKARKAPKAPKRARS